VGTGALPPRRPVTGRRSTEWVDGGMDLFGLKTWVRARWGRRDERGANLVEYLLLVGLIAIVAMAAISFLGGQLTPLFNQAGSQVSQAP
jgi:pilus assembly protein Flp/PilA